MPGGIVSDICCTSCPKANTTMSNNTVNAEDVEMSDLEDLDEANSEDVEVYDSEDVEVHDSEDVEVDDSEDVGFYDSEDLENMDEISVGVKLPPRTSNGNLGLCELVLKKQVSRSSCKPGMSYGCLTSEKMYVRHGCRADFSMYNRKVHCASWNFKDKICEMELPPRSSNGNLGLCEPE